MGNLRDLILYTSFRAYVNSFLVKEDPSPLLASVHLRVPFTRLSFMFFAKASSTQVNTPKHIWEPALAQYTKLFSNHQSVAISMLWFHLETLPCCIQYHGFSKAKLLSLDLYLVQCLQLQSSCPSEDVGHARGVPALTEPPCWHSGPVCIQLKPHSPLSSCLPSLCHLLQEQHQHL